MIDLLQLAYTTIVPIVKNKCGNISESNNYRPIALATIISKLFESVLLLKCEDYLSTCSNQFGFKKGHITDLCIYALNEYIEYYKNRNASVFVTMLDARKAFGRVNFWLLFQKLLSRNVPLFIVRIFAMVYSSKDVHQMGQCNFSIFYYFQWCKARWYYIANSFQCLYGWVKCIIK